MDGFSLAVLERTLELVIDAMEPERNPEIAAEVNVIRQYIESPETEDSADLRRVVLQLAERAHTNRQFLIAARLDSFAQEMTHARRNHDVA
ncbi:MAG TPA: hypothetical protein VKY31_05755 [Terriglobia bacterium]|nr:hypothetical protein [Terriglobia bacterium]